MIISKDAEKPFDKIQRHSVNLVTFNILFKR